MQQAIAETFKVSPSTMSLCVTARGRRGRIARSKWIRRVLFCQDRPQSDFNF